MCGGSEEKFYSYYSQEPFGSVILKRKSIIKDLYYEWLENEKKSEAGAGLVFYTYLIEMDTREA